MSSSSTTCVLLVRLIHFKPGCGHELPTRSTLEVRDQVFPSLPHLLATRQDLACGQHEAAGTGISQLERQADFCLSNITNIVRTATTSSI